ncbi:hypothetical protein D9756_008647 [Leucocoprinus leucothites]|uniref:SANT domain-containing protein n=1 Tax=Leucocoprinus leucothites TaxID=201217 RepID=A0A8H5CYW4_9AGAR|nr:hypothetical protein D9756_008647 [Leucoagaricus leucothites]
MPPKELDPDVYSSIFDRHLQETQVYLQRAAFPEERTENQVVGSVLWTYDEINIFFHALAIHSRLRPDLISACIRTKNVLDVVEYLDLLDDNSKLVGRQSSNDGNRVPIAHEMSNSWVSWEENQARSLQTRENNSRKQASRRILQRSFENENVAGSALDAEYSP